MDPSVLCPICAKINNVYQWLVNPNRTGWEKKTSAHTDRGNNLNNFLVHPLLTLRCPYYISKQLAAKTESITWEKERFSSWLAGRIFYNMKEAMKREICLSISIIFDTLLLVFQFNKLFWWTELLGPSFTWSRKQFFVSMLLLSLTKETKLLTMTLKFLHCLGFTFHMLVFSFNLYLRFMS